MRTRMFASIACGLFTVANVGCGWFGGSQPSGGVAVVDLDEVARQVGADSEIVQAVQAREASLNSQLKVMKANYVQQLKERKSLYGEQPNEEQSKQLDSITRQVNLNLVTAQQKATSHLSSHRGELIMKFREQVGPVAQQIANERGLAIVVPKNDGWLLAVDENVDITNEVAESLKSQWKPIVSSASAPAPQVAGQTPAGQSISQPAASGPSGVQPAGYEQPLPQTP